MFSCVAICNDGIVRRPYTNLCVTVKYTLSCLSEVVVSKHKVWLGLGFAG